MTNYTISLGDRQVEQVMDSLALRSRDILDRWRRTNPSASKEGLSQRACALAIRQLQREIDKRMMVFALCAQDCWDRIAQIQTGQVRVALLRIIGMARPIVRAGRHTPRRICSSASEASRHRESDDAGGDGDDDPDSDLPLLNRQLIALLRSTFGANSAFETALRASLLKVGGEAR